MGMKVEHDRPHDELHLIFREDRIIATDEWCAENATIALAADGLPVSVTIYRYYTNPRWLFDEHFVEKYSLGPHLDDLALIYQEFFQPKGYGVKSIRYEGPDGEEIIVGGGHTL